MYYDLEDYLDEEAQMTRKEIISIINWMEDNRPSLRQASEDLCIPHTTLHKRIHTYVKDYFPEDYAVIKHLLYMNKKYRFKRRSLWRPSDLT